VSRVCLNGYSPYDDSEKPLEIRSRMAAGTKVVNI
jgi:hypothetical protein